MDLDPTITQDKTVNEIKIEQQSVNDSVEAEVNYEVKSAPEEDEESELQQQQQQQQTPVIKEAEGDVKVEALKDDDASKPDITKVVCFYVFFS